MSEDAGHLPDDSPPHPNVPQGASAEAGAARVGSDGWYLSDYGDAAPCSLNASQSQNLSPLDSKAAVHMTLGTQHPCLKDSSDGVPILHDAFRRHRSASNCANLSQSAHV